MELLEGETLAARLERGPLPPSEARRLLLQICEALEAAHQERIVHARPETREPVDRGATPRQPYAKILDFGIAKLAEDRDASLATETGVAMGTPHFMAPEQCRGETTIDARADIYAMGVILYKMFTGRLPFEGASFLAVVTQQITAAPAPPSVHARLPPRLEALILRCLQKDPAGRPQRARALGQELGEILEHALPGETLPPRRRRRRRHMQARRAWRRRPRREIIPHPRGSRGIADGRGDGRRSGGCGRHHRNPRLARAGADPASRHAPALAHAPRSGGAHTPGGCVARAAAAATVSQPAVDAPRAKPVPRARPRRDEAAGARRSTARRRASSKAAT
jgi:hypothetical protein